MPEMDLLNLKDLRKWSIANTKKTIKVRLTKKGRKSGADKKNYQGLCLMNLNEYPVIPR